MENEAVDEAVWRIRATAWELAALGFRYPGEELAGAAASGEWSEAAAEVLAVLGLEAPEGLGAGTRPDALSLLRELRPEATRLFVGAPEPACSPYEGVWAARADGVQALLFVSPRSMEVERFVRSCGFGRPDGTNEPLDHVATECELLEHLALRAASGDPEAPGAYDAFLQGHARTWMPVFAAAVRAESRHPFYRAAAAYLGALAG